MGIVVNVRDVTERKRTEERLLETEVRYRAMVERMPAITYTQKVDGDLATTFVSPQVEAVLGYSPQEYLSEPKFYLNIIHPEDRKRVRSEDEYKDETGETFLSEYRMLARDGRVVWLRDEAVIARDEDGHPLFWQGFMLDVTEQKRAETELRESEERFRALVQNSLDFVALCDLDNRVRYVSPSVTDILGYEPEELEGVFVTSLMHPDDLEAAARDAERIFTEPAVRAQPIRYRRKDGSYAYLEGVFSNRASEPSVRGVVCNMRDVTEKIKSDEELRQNMDLILTLQETGQILGATKMSRPCDAPRGPRKYWTGSATSRMPRPRTTKR